MRQDTLKEGVAIGPGHAALGKHPVEFPHVERRESAREARRRARREDQLGCGCQRARPAPPRGKADRQAMLGFANFGGTVEQQLLLMAREVRCRYEQIERMAVWDQRRLRLACGHCLAGVEQEARKAPAAKRWRKPARADEIGELAADFRACLGRDGALDRVAALTHHQPEQWARPEFGEARERAGVGIDQHIGIGGVQP